MAPPQVHRSAGGPGAARLAPGWHHGGMPPHRIAGTSFSTIHGLYVAKAERKGHGPDEVDEVICWLTGHDAESLEKAIADEVDLETFFAQVPALNPNASLVTGLICGHRVEDIEDPLMWRIRCMDKLVDEVARGKRMSSILRQGASDATGR